MGNGREIRIAAVGDILLSDGYFDIGYGMGSQIRKRGPHHVFESIKGCFDENELIAGNLECAISDNTEKKGLRAREFLSSPVVIDSLTLLGLDVALLANNHVLQHGVKVYRETVERLQKAGIDVVGSRVGTGTSGKVPQVLVTRPFGENVVGFLGYSMVDDEHNPRVDAYAHCTDAEEIAKEIAYNRRSCDCLVLLLHWGKEFVSYPSREQVEAGRRFVDAGADVIIGSHPHVLQGVEIYKGKTIAYSLGNFVFNMPAAPCRQSAILRLKINADGKQYPSVEPVWLDDDGRPGIPTGNIREIIESTIELNDRDIWKYLNGEREYESDVAAGLSVHRAMLKKQFVRNMKKMEKRVVVKMLYEFMKRRVGAAISGKREPDAGVPGR